VVNPGLLTAASYFRGSKQMDGRDPQMSENSDHRDTSTEMSRSQPNARKPGCRFAIAIPAVPWAGVDRESEEMLHPSNKTSIVTVNRTAYRLSNMP
jgi:Trm5-related predicted tRNA methylase